MAVLLNKDLLSCNPQGLQPPVGSRLKREARSKTIVPWSTLKKSKVTSRTEDERVTACQAGAKTCTTITERKRKMKSCGGKWTLSNWWEKEGEESQIVTSKFYRIHSTTALNNYILF